MTRHCTDDELQLLAGGQPVPEPGMMQHIENCASCREQMAAYRYIFSEIKKQPAAVFDFDLAGAVLEQWQPVKTRASGYNVFAVITIVLIAVFVIVSLWIFRKNFLFLSASTSATFLALSAATCTGVIGYKIVQLYHRYNQQIKKLNFSE